MLTRRAALGLIPAGVAGIAAFGIGAPPIQAVPHSWLTSASGWMHLTTNHASFLVYHPSKEKEVRAILVSNYANQPLSG